MAAVLHRREALKALLAGGALAVASRAKVACAQSTAVPRYLVLAYLSGGVDSIFTMDPKTRRDVDPDVDLTYEPSAIAGTGNVRLGPHWRSLEPWAQRMAIVRGVRVFTANHPTGGRQLVRFRTDSAESMPTLFDLVGAHRDGQPLATVTVGRVVESGLYSPSFFGTSFGSSPSAVDLFESLEHTTGDERALMSEFLQARAREVAAGAGARSETTEAVANLRSAERFFAKAATLPPWQPVKWGDDPRAQPSAADAQRALWFLENDLTRTVVWAGKPAAWDTHTYNDKLQRENNERFAPQLARFLEELSTRKNEHGPLLDNTLVVVASELGRFPMTNKLEGKDHFPEIALTFIGKGVRGGKVFGETGKRLEGARVSLRTGGADPSGVAMQLDDIGTTLLRICGVDDTPYGYRGRSLDFLRA